MKFKREYYNFPKLDNRTVSSKKDLEFNSWIQFKLFSSRRHLKSLDQMWKLVGVRVKSVVSYLNPKTEWEQLSYHSENNYAAQFISILRDHAILFLL